MKKREWKAKYSGGNASTDSDGADDKSEKNADSRDETMPAGAEGAEDSTDK